ncbi:MAG: FAD binding domain-containing protein [Sulfitobacter sp.]
MTDVVPYLRPVVLEDALDALAAGAWRIAAGCTDLFPATERKALQGAILDITRIENLRGISRTEDGIRIGAATTWTDLIRADLPPACTGLQLAAREVGASQIQNRGTIAGNLCNASPAADGVPPLLTLDAVVEIRSATSTRHVPLQEFITGPRQTALSPSEMVTSVLLPETALAGKGHFVKLGARAYLVISISMTAARLVVEDGVVTQAALSIGSCGPVATRLPEVEALMIGKPIDTGLISDAMVAAAINPIADMRADAAYRATSAAELLRRTVEVLAFDTEAQS